MTELEKAQRAYLVAESELANAQVLKTPEFLSGWAYIIKYIDTLFDVKTRETGNAERILGELSAYRRMKSLPIELAENAVSSAINRSAELAAIKKDEDYVDDSAESLEGLLPQGSNEGKNTGGSEQ